MSERLIDDFKGLYVKDTEGNFDLDGDGIVGFDFNVFFRRPIPLAGVLVLTYLVKRFL